MHKEVCGSLSPLVSNIMGCAVRDENGVVLVEDMNLRLVPTHEDKVDSTVNDSDNLSAVICAVEVHHLAGVEHDEPGPHPWAIKVALVHAVDNSLVLPLPANAAGCGLECDGRGRDLHCEEVLFVYLKDALHKRTRPDTIKWVCEHVALPLHSDHVRKPLRSKVHFYG